MNSAAGNYPPHGYSHGGSPGDYNGGAHFNGGPQPGAQQPRLAGGDRAPGYEPPETSPKITPQFVLRATRRWWKVAVPIGLLLAVIAGLIVGFLYEAQYMAQYWLRIEDETFVVTRGERTSAGKFFAQTQAQLITSPLVVEQVLARPDVANLPYIIEHNSPVNFLSRRIDIKARADSELFIVGFSGPDPKDSAMVCNAIIDAYLKMHSQDEAQRTQRVIELLENERDRRANTVTDLRRTIKEVKEKTYGKQGDQYMLGDEGVLKHDLNALQDKITTAEVDKELLQARLSAFEEQIKDKVIEVDEEEVRKSVGSNARLAQMQQTIAELDRRMNEYRVLTTGGNKSPQYLQLADEVSKLQKEMLEHQDKLEENARKSLTKKAEAERAKFHAEVTGRIKDLERKIKLYSEKFMVQYNATKKKGDLNLDLIFKMSELNREEKTLDLISARITRLRTEMRAPARITPLRAAQPPVQPVEPFPYRQIGLVSFLTFCVPFVLAVFWEKIVCRVDGPQQLWQADLNVVGEVAKLPVSSRIAGISGNVGRDVSLFEESIDSLRTCLVLSERGAKSRVLVVSSAVSGEGKTSVASQLAVSIARASGEPTLLIDADMRSPDIHNVFDIPNEPGLAQVLAHECSIEDAIVTTWSNYVHILPAGVLRASPHKLLGDGQIKAFLADVSSRYKHVIIDTSPILSASESLVLAKAADGTLLCAMRDVSRVDQVQKAYERLVNTGARPLGTVLNGVPTNRYAYLYGVYAYPRD